MFLNSASGSNHDQQPKQHPVNISPNLMKNFNLYEILEPQKVYNSSNTTENDSISLIDLDGSTKSASGVKNNTAIHEDVTGFDLVDVFQNIYVTPELVKNQQKKDEGKTEVNNDMNDFFRKLGSGKKINWIENDAIEKVNEKSNDHLDFEQTFDKIVQNRTETPHKYTNTPINFVDNSTAPDNEDLIEELLLNKSFEKTQLPDVIGNLHNVRVLSTPVLQNKAHSDQQNSIFMPNVEHSLSAPKKDSSPGILYRDVPWKLQQPTHQINSHNPSSELNNTMFQHTPITDNNSTLPRDYDMHYIKNITTENNTFKQNSVNTSPVFQSEKVSIHNNKERPISPSESNLDDAMVLNFLKAMDCKEFKWKSPQDSTRSDIPFISDKDSASNVPKEKNSNSNLTLSEIFIKNNNNKLEKLKLNVQKGPLNVPFYSDTFTIINASIDPASLISSLPIKPIIKDPKAFNKNRRVKSDHEKQTYTKGPTLREKSVVLPQILCRLSLEKKVFEEKNKLRKRLILDVGSMKADKGVTIPVELKPTVLMADCNKERLRAFETRKLVDEFVRKGNIL